MAMAMASVGHDKSGFPDGVFVFSGKSYHQIGTLVPREGCAPNFAQIYAVDTSGAIERRSAVFGDRLNRQTLQALHDVLVEHNRYVSEFRRAVADGVNELVWTTEDNIMGMQMGALVCANGSKRNVVLKRHADVNCQFANDLCFINDGHPLYHTLTYPLLFPTGAPGWFAGMVSSLGDGSLPSTVTLHEYGRYVLMHRQRCDVLCPCIIRVLMICQAFSCSKVPPIGSGILLRHVGSKRSTSSQLSFFAFATNQISYGQEMRH
jgi:hypothetical protein